MAAGDGDAPGSGDRGALRLGKLGEAVRPAGRRAVGALGVDDARAGAKRDVGGLACGLIGQTENV